eukprot:gene6760-10360_t
MTSVPAMPNAVWRTLGLPDMSATAYTNLQTRPRVKPLQRTPASSLKATFHSQHTRGDHWRNVERGSDSDSSDGSEDMSIMGGISRERIRQAWLSPAGLSRATRTAMQTMQDMDDYNRHGSNTPTGKPFQPLSMSPRRHHIADMEDQRHMFNALPRQGYAAGPSPMLDRGGAGPETRGVAVAELVDAVKRVVFSLRAFKDDGAALPHVADAEWNAAVEGMKDPLHEIANSVDSVVEPLYKHPSLRERNLLRADDAMYPLEFLLQATTHLRDTITDAAKGSPNFFGDRSLGKYVADATFYHNTILLAVRFVMSLAQHDKLSKSTTRPRAGTGATLELHTTDRRDLSVQLLAELVPCPASRRYWISQFGATVLEVDTAMFITALQAFVVDMLPGLSKSIVAGIADTLNHQGHVTLSSFASVFGFVSILDSIDVLSQTGPANITFEVLSTPLSEWNPPTSRYKLHVRDKDDERTAALALNAAKELLQRAQPTEVAALRKQLAGAVDGSFSPGRAQHDGARPARWQSDDLPPPAGSVSRTPGSRSWGTPGYRDLPSQIESTASASQLAGTTPAARKVTVGALLDRAAEQSQARRRPRSGTMDSFHEWMELNLAD